MAILISSSLKKFGFLSWLGHYLYLLFENIAICLRNHFKKISKRDKALFILTRGQLSSIY